MKPKKPNGILYFLAILVLWPYMKLCWHVKIHKKGFTRPEGAFVIVGNHVTFYDFITIALALYPRRINFVAAAYFFQGKLLGRLLRFMGVIPKLQFVPDIGSIKAIMGAVRSGRAVGLFPEGQVATYGRSDEFFPSGIGKLLKNLGVPVVLCHADGGALVKPKWGKRKRRCPLDMTVSNLLSAEQVKQYSAAQLDGILREALFYDDAAYALAHNRRPKGKARAEGLENALYLCPKCGAQGTYRAQGDRFFCTGCGNTGVLDAHGLPAPAGPEDKVFPTLYQWHRFQAEQTARLCAAPDFRLVTRGKIHFPQESLPGTAQLDREGITITVEGRSEHYPLSSIQHMPCSVGKYFEIPRKSGIITVYPADPKEIMRWPDAVAALKKNG